MHRSTTCPLETNLISHDHHSNSRIRANDIIIFVAYFYRERLTCPHAPLCNDVQSLANEGNNRFLGQMNKQRLNLKKERGGSISSISLLGVNG